MRSYQHRPGAGAPGADKSRRESMKEIPINLWAVLVAALVKMVVGAIWYSPPLFAGPWQKLTGVGEADMKAALPKAMAVDLIGSLIMAFVLAHAVVYAGAATVVLGAAVGFFSWLGFVATVTIAQVTYERRPFRLFLINNGALLVSLVLMGAILAIWR
jgi:hypothetical protein